jgi:replicative DNA helicase Mcm
MDYVAKWEEFLRSRYWDDLLELADSYPDERSIIVQFSDLDRYDPDFAEELLESNSDEVLEAARTALLEVDLPMDVYLDRAHVRVIGLPRKRKIRDLTYENIGKFLAIEGMVKTVTETRPKIVSAAIQCRRCGYTFFKEQTGAKFDDQNIKCQNQACDRGGPFRLMVDKSKFIDACKVRLQEFPEGLKGGQSPQTINVELEDDIARKVQAGNRVVINGILKAVQRSNPQAGKSNYFDYFLQAASLEMKEQEFEEIEITPDDEKEILRLSRDPSINDKIVRSIAPAIYGNEEVKAALALQLFSGHEKNLPDGTRIRGDIHILLCGDPGIAKSQLLRYMTKIAPRAVYTSGKGVTSAGLTATVVRDELSDGRWTVEAGALVLADKGMAAVDELDKMEEDDRNALHQAMEQQIVSINKAAVSATLMSRCSMLSAANPKEGRFDKYEPIAPQINLTPALMSRFDLIFVLDDVPEESKDDRISDHIIKSNAAGEMLNQFNNKILEISQDELDQALEIVKPEIDPALLRKYVAYSRKKFFPLMSSDAQKHLQKFYKSIRAIGQGGDKPVPVTARQLEALIRLAEARARIRLSQVVTEEDAQSVIEIVASCLKKIGIDKDTGLPDIDAIELGATKSMRDKTKEVLDLIRDVQNDSGISIISEDKVIKRAEYMGMDGSKVKEILDRMKRDGHIIEVKPGYVKVP